MKLLNEEPQPTMTLAEFAELPHKELVTHHIFILTNQGLYKVLYLASRWVAPLVIRPSHMDSDHSVDVCVARFCGVDFKLLSDLIAYARGRAFEVHVFTKATEASEFVKTYIEGLPT